jgi:hypothetical protein
MKFLSLAVLIISASAVRRGYSSDPYESMGTDRMERIPMEDDPYDSNTDPYVEIDPDGDGFFVPDPTDPRRGIYYVPFDPSDISVGTYYVVAPEYGTYYDGPQ